MTVENNDGQITIKCNGSEWKEAMHNAAMYYGIYYAITEEK